MVLVTGDTEHRAGFDHLYFETEDGIEIHRFSFPAGFHYIYDDDTTKILLEDGPWIISLYLLPWYFLPLLPKYMLNGYFLQATIYTLITAIPFLAFYFYKYGTRLPLYCPINPSDVEKISVTKLRDFEYWRLLYDIKTLIPKYNLSDDDIIQYIFKPIMVERILEQDRHKAHDYTDASEATLFDDFCNYISWYSYEKTNRINHKEEIELKEEADILMGVIEDPDQLAWEAWAIKWDNDHPILSKIIETMFKIYDWHWARIYKYYDEVLDMEFPDTSNMTDEEFQEMLDEDLVPPDWFWWYDAVLLEGDVVLDDSEFNHFQQFDDHLIFDSYNKNLFDYSISVVTLSAMIIYLLIILIQNSVKNTSNVMPTKTQYLLEMLNKFVLNIVKEQTNGLAIKYTPLFFTVFLTILLFNMQGIVPTSFTITSQIAATGFFALTIFFALLIINILFAPLIFIKSFIPKNTPKMIKPLLFIIELLSFLLRPISMSVRLFANMMAGHILLHILIGAFIFSLLYLPILVTLPIYAITIGIFILEVGIAALQSYILVVLFGIYLKETLINVIRT